MAGDQLCLSITSRVFRQALKAGPAGSSAYQSVIVAAVSELETKEDCLTADIAANGGRQILSISAGESVTYSTPPMTQEDLFSAYECAIAKLSGTVMLYRRTSARYLY